MPGDPVVQEFKALVLFARGDYARAAAVLHAVLAVTRGMDWPTLIGLYPNVEAYTAQLRALENACRKDPKAAAFRLVLAYQYLVAGHKDAAVERLRSVVALEPSDRVARGLLASLTPAPRRHPRPRHPRPTETRTRAQPRRRASLATGEARRKARSSICASTPGAYSSGRLRQGKATAAAGASAFAGKTLTLTPEDWPPLRASLTELSAGYFRFATLGEL